MKWKSAEFLAPGDQVVMRELGSCRVLKVLDAADGDVVVVLVKPSGEQAVLKFAPWEQVLMQREIVL